jgi:beta-glucosidase
MFNKHHYGQGKLVTKILIVALISFSGASQAVAEPQQQAAPTPQPLVIYGSEGAVAPNTLFLGSPTNWAYTVPKSGTAPLDAGSIKVEPTKVGDSNGIKVTWTGGIGQIYSQSKLTNDQLDFLDANGALVFDAIVHKRPEDQVTMRVDCRYPCMGIVDMTKYYQEIPLETKQTVKIPLACFEKTGTRFTAVNTPWLIFTTKPFAVSLANIRWVPSAGKDPDAVKCGD